MRKIIKQGEQSNIDAMYKKIYDRHSSVFTEDNTPTLIGYMFNNMLRMTDNITFGSNYLEQIIINEVRVYFKRGKL